MPAESAGQEPEEPEVGFKHPGGKLCPKCKAWQTSDNIACTECGARPFMWRTEYKVILWVVLLFSIGLIVFTAWNANETP
jgi:hypothetical protein